MTITPADSLDLLIARGPPDATDFAKQIAGLPGAYYAGLDEAYKRRTQDAFQNGLPLTNPKDPNSPVDLQSLYKTLLATGGAPAGIEVAKALQEQASQQSAAETARRAFPLPGDQIPPSTAPTSVAAPALRSTSGPPGSSNGSSSTSVNAAVSGAGFTGADAGSLMTRIAQGLGVDPDQNLDPVKQAQVATAVQRAVQARQSVAAPVAAPVASPTLAFNDRFRGASPPAVPPTLSSTQDPAIAAQRAALEQRRNALQRAGAAQEALRKGAGRPYLDAAAEIDKQLQPTEAQKNALGDKRPNETQSQYEARKAAEAETSKGVAGIGVDTLKSAAAGYQAAQTAKLGLDQIDDAINSLGPAGWMGTGAGPRLQFARAFNTVLNALPESVVSQDTKKEIQFDPSKIAKLEDFNKQSLKLGFETAKTLGSREAMQIVQQATKSVPNFEQSPLGAKLVSSSLRQAAQRQEDYYKFLARPENQGRVGAEIDFNNQNPPLKYSLRALGASGLPVPIKNQTEFGYLESGTHFVKDGKTWLKP